MTTSLETRSTPTERPWLRRRLARMFRPPRRAIPTRAGLFALGAPLVLGVAAISASNNLLMMLLGAALGAIVLSGIISERNLRGVEVRVRQVAPAYAEEPASLEVEFHSESDKPSYGLQVRERIQSIWIPWMTAKTKRAKLLDVQIDFLERRRGTKIGHRVFPRRGRAVLAGCELVTTYPFGLLFKSKDIDVSIDVLVRPRRIPVPQALEDPRSVAADGQSSDRRGVGIDVYGLREREMWDPVLRVHALRSQSLGKDVVIETTSLEQKTAWLGIANDAAADPEAFERALEVAAATLTEWTYQGYAIGVATLNVAYAPNERSRDEILDLLAGLERAAPADEPARGPSVWVVPQGARVPHRGVTLVRVDAAGSISVESPRVTDGELPS